MPERRGGAEYVEQRLCSALWKKTHLDPEDRKQPLCTLHRRHEQTKSYENRTKETRKSLDDRMTTSFGAWLLMIFVPSCWPIGQRLGVSVISLFIRRMSRKSCTYFGSQNARVHTIKMQAENAFTKLCICCTQKHTHA